MVVGVKVCSVRIRVEIGMGVEYVLCGLLLGSVYGVLIVGCGFVVVLLLSE